MTANDKHHWDDIYINKQPEEVSWTQDVPRISLDFIRNFKLPKSASIIDIGGGDSNLVDHLLEEGYRNITVLDISEKALERARKRLGNKSTSVKWIVSDVTEFVPVSKFDVWHDRATFHFLTTPAQIEQYLTAARKAVTGFLTIGTFSENGPEKCSGLDIKQYSENQLQKQLAKGFTKLQCVTEDHITPSKSLQNFLFCSFKVND